MARQAHDSSEAGARLVEVETEVQSSCRWCKSGTVDRASKALTSRPPDTRATKQIFHPHHPSTSQLHQIFLVGPEQTFFRVQPGPIAKPARTPCIAERDPSTRSSQ